MRLLLVLERMFSIGKLGTPEFAAAAMFRLDDLFFPLATFEEVDAL